MKYARNLAVGIILGGATVSAIAELKLINFEEPPIPLNSAQNQSVGTFYAGVNFQTFIGAGSAGVSSDFAYVVGSGAFADNQNFSLGNQVFKIAPIQNSVTYPFTQIDFAGGINGDFSFVYGSDARLQVLYSVDGTNFLLPKVAQMSVTGFGDVSLSEPNSEFGLFGSTFDTECSGVGKTCRWGAATIKFGSAEIKSIIFRDTDTSADATAAMIDRLSYNTIQGVVPEPSTYALMVLGLLGIGFVARRRLT